MTEAGFLRAQARPRAERARGSEQERGRGEVREAQGEGVTARHLTRRSTFLPLRNARDMSVMTGMRSTS